MTDRVRYRVDDLYVRIAKIAKKEEISGRCKAAADFTSLFDVFEVPLHEALTMSREHVIVEFSSSETGALFGEMLRQFREERGAVYGAYMTCDVDLYNKQLKAWIFPRTALFIVIHLLALVDRNKCIMAGVYKSEKQDSEPAL